ncbi:hypothetical protein SAMN02745202_00875 [Segatella oulorum]|uniref:Uncharacterized protein n=1 Tax=Segatella oulorum TaxID=28136 RepID=A0A1T4MX68_9BACT|nr:hypothetical protein SAMN02745202_00875 [Segatella oulorum]
MVGAAPVCPPERPRSGVSIRKGHVPIHKSSISIRKGHILTRKGGISIRKGYILTRKGGVSIHKRCMLTPKYVCALRRWMRPHGAMRSGTQAPTIPASIKPFYHATFLVFVRRQSLFRQPFLVLICRRAPLRQGCVISTVSYYKLHNFISVRLYFCFKNSAKWRLHNSCFRKVVCVSTHTPRRRSDTKQKYHSSLKL